MKIRKTIYNILLLLTLSFLCIGCGNSKAASGEDGITGTWKNSEDTITFSDDGSFSSYFYFSNGQWEEFEEGKLNITTSLLGTEKYAYEINDQGILILNNLYKNSEGQWNTGKMIYTFVREDADESILDNYEETPIDLNSADAGDSGSDEGSSDASTEMSTEISDDADASTEDIANNSGTSETENDTNTEAASDIASTESSTADGAYDDEYLKQAGINYMSEVLSKDIAGNDLYLVDRYHDSEDNNIFIYEIWYDDKVGVHPIFVAMGGIDIYTLEGWAQYPTTDSDKIEVNYAEYCN